MFKENIELPLRTKDTEIEKLLTNLGIKDVNSGVTTGTKWFDANGDITSSNTPAQDGEYGYSYL